MGRWPNQTGEERRIPPPSPARKASEFAYFVGSTTRPTNNGAPVASSRITYT